MGVGGMGRPVAQKRASRVTAVASGAACRWRRVGRAGGRKGGRRCAAASWSLAWGNLGIGTAYAIRRYVRVFSVADLFELARGTPHAVTVPSRVESVAAPGSAVLVT